ncbi:hypothetical protein [Paenibacillus illinoisensis]|uniref:hypothetical protein n=1 Tax=Paenibacillus illinoisensis TaxID=59845 RepID=UPI0030163F9F
MFLQPYAVKQIGEFNELVIYSKDFKSKNRPQGNQLTVGMRFKGKPTGMTHEYKVKRGICETGMMYLIFGGIRYYLNEFTSIAYT